MNSVMLYFTVFIGFLLKLTNRTIIFKLNYLAFLVEHIHGTEISEGLLGPTFIQQHKTEPRLQDLPTYLTSLIRDVGSEIIELAGDFKRSLMVFKITY